MNVGQVIAQRFEIGEFIRQGGMGAVYRGRDRQSGQTVALKVLKAEALSDDPANVERFAREGEALRTLNHPNIVKMLAMVEDNGQRYLVMEYVSGGSLADLLAAQPQLPTRRVLEIGLDLADALTRTHRLDIIHRDLKPANVLIAEDGTPRLTDFGVARIGNSDMTGSGQVVGTYSYLSPEALNGLALDGRADIWAFGVLLFEMLAGRKPFAADNPGAVMSAILNKPTPDLEALCPDAPVALIDLIYRMLEKDREQRIGSVRLVGAEVERLMRGEITPDLRGARQPSAAGIDHSTIFTASTPSEGERTPHNLPAQATAFVGREAELAELAKLLDSSRLVTVLGPGGMGKTRLAMEAAAGQVKKYANGVYFVSLAPLSAPETIVPTIAEAVRFSFYGGTEPKQQLLDFLRARRMLLVLDNFEHLLASVGLVSEILQAAPGVKILATSRERLNVEGETVFRLEGMDFPDWETPEDAAEYSAVKLFLQSARRVQPDFGLDMDNLKYVARICRLVQGMPLGILLAAAWVEALALPEIAQEIEKSLGFLESEQRDLPARHRSLRAAFDYSWNLLTDSEREVFKKLSVFRGGFTREAAQQVAGASLKTLMNLVNKSLLRRDASTGRYEIHELLRQYGGEQLEAAGEAEATQQVHTQYYAHFMQEREDDLKGRRLLAAVKEITANFDNIRLTWMWILAHRDFDALNQVVDTLFKYGVDHNRLETQRLFQQGLEQLTPHADEALHPGWGRLAARSVNVLGTGQPSIWENIARTHNSLLEQGLQIARRHGDMAEIGFCLWAQGRLRYAASFPNFNAAEISRALSLFEESLAYYDQLDNELRRAFYTAEALFWMASCYRLLGQHDQAIDGFRGSLALGRQTGDLNVEGWALLNLGFMCLVSAHISEAEQYFREGEAVSRLAGNSGAVSECEYVFGVIALLNGDSRQARLQVVAALTRANEIGSKIIEGEMRALLGVTACLDEDYPRAKQLCEEGHRLGQTDTLLYPADWGLSLAYCGLEDYHRSRQYVETLLRKGLPQRNTLSLVLSLPAQAVILAHEDAKERAVELLGLALSYADNVAGWMQQWPLLTRLRANLQGELGQDIYDAAWERGKILDLDTVVAAFLAE